MRISDWSSDVCSSDLSEPTFVTSCWASSSLPPLAVIAGPTASGKSAFALRMAETRRGVIINADASQCYADLCVLSARPSAAETARAPHRHIGRAACRERVGTYV